MSQVASIARTFLDPLEGRTPSEEQTARQVCAGFQELLGCSLVVLCTHDPVTDLPGRVFRGEGELQVPTPLQHRFARAFCARDLQPEDSLSVTALRQRPGGADAYGMARRRGVSELHARLPLPLRMLGLRDELRVLLQDEAGLWATVAVARRSGDFDEEDLGAVAELAALATRCLRRAAQRAWVHSESGDQSGPGLVLLGEIGQVLELDARAAELLGDLGQDHLHLWTRALLLREASGEEATMTIAGPQGGLSVRLSNLAGERVAIVQPAQGRDYAERILRGLPLTPREREVVRGVCRGWDNRRVAFELDMADATVKVHLRRVYAKVGVSGRQELAEYVLRGLPEG